MDKGARAQVVVVGAGPAGSAAATFLALRGIRVTLLDKARFPRDKVCGGLCAPRAVWTLGRLGIDPVRDAGGLEIRRVWTCSPGGEVLDSEIPAHIFGGRAAVVERRRLDQAMVNAATAAGARLVEHAHVTNLLVGASGAQVLVADQPPVEADLVLGCDGAPSVVRRVLGAPEFPLHHKAWAVRAVFDGCTLTHPDAAAGWWYPHLAPAYGWVFPLPGGRANVGVMARADKVDELELDLKTLLKHFCAAPEIACQLKGATLVGRVMGHQLPFGSFAHRLAYPRALLLGDAAGLINPLTGEGLEYALESAELAADVVVSAVARGDFSRAALQPYEARCHQRFTRAFRVNHALQWVFRHSTLADRVLKAASRSASVRDKLAETLLGQSPRFSPRLALAAAWGA